MKGDGRFFARHTRWYFDGQTCKEFLWSGLQRNGNNFRCKELCEKTCVA